MAICAPILFAACSVGPDYVRPTAPTAAAFKEVDGWKVAQPGDGIIRGPWWEIFQDPVLSALEEQVSISNQNVAAAEAQVRQARAVIQAARAAYFPTVTVGVGVSRFRQQTTGSGSGTPAAITRNSFTLPLDATWELDLWGRVRRNVESQTAGAQATAADLESTRLSAQATLAQSYFTLRQLDAQRRLLDQTVDAFQKSLELTQHRYAGGVASRADVVQAQTQLKTTQAQAIDVGVQRAQLEHAIAALTGTPASQFSFPVAPLAAAPPPVPIGVPSQLLERRPDIAAAERRVAAANAQIGVAVAAYYPTVTLSASAGFESPKISDWFSWPSRFFSVGPSVSETVFDGGLRHADVLQTRAAYDASVATYRQAVLGAFQEVEDNLAALRILDDEARVQDEAVSAARQSVDLTMNQYKAGTVSYLNVIVAQTAALSDEQTAVVLLGRRMTASVLLVQALGGGWTSANLPTAAAFSEKETPPQSQP